MAYFISSYGDLRNLPNQDTPHVYVFCHKSRFKNNKKKVTLIKYIGIMEKGISTILKSDQSGGNYDKVHRMWGDKHYFKIRQIWWKLFVSIYASWFLIGSRCILFV